MLQTPIKTLLMSITNHVQTVVLFTHNRLNYIILIRIMFVVVGKIDIFYGEFPFLIFEGCSSSETVYDLLNRRRRPSSSPLVVTTRERGGRWKVVRALEISGAIVCAAKGMSVISRVGIR